MGHISRLQLVERIVSSKSQTCPDEEKEAKLRERQSLDHRELVFNFLLVVSTVSFVKETTLNVLVPELPSTLPPSWSTWPPRFWSWLAMPPGTTRRPVSFPDIFNLPSVTMKSSTNSWPVSPLPKEVSCPTSKPSCCPRRLKRPPKLNYFVRMSWSFLYLTKLIFV